MSGDASKNVGKAGPIPCKEIKVQCKKKGFLSGLVKGKSSKLRPVREITQTGVRFASKESYRDGESLEMRLDFGSGRPKLDVEGEVVKVRNISGTKAYEVHARFVEVEADTWEILGRLSRRVTSKRMRDTWGLAMSKKQEGEEAEEEPEEPVVQQTGTDLSEVFRPLGQNEAMEQLEALLDARNRLAGEENEVILAPSTVENKLEGLREESQQLQLSGDPVGTFFHSEKILNELASLRHVKLPKALQEQRAELREQVEHRREQITAHWDEETKTKIRKLAGLDRRATTYVRQILDRMKEVKQGQRPGTARRGGEEQLSITFYVERLARLIEAVKQLQRNLPGINPTSLPHWALLEQARKRIIEPHRRNIFLFKCATLIARADGRLQHAERNFLRTVARRVPLTSAETATLIGESDAVSAHDVQASPREALAVIQKLCMVTLAGTGLSEEERSVLERIGSSWGIPPEKVHAIVRDGRKLHELTDEARTALKRLVSQIDSFQNANPGETQTLALKKDIDRLAGLVDVIESKVRVAAGVRMEDIEDWGLFEKARQAIINPYRHNLFLFNCALQMTLADGQISESERKFLYTIADHIMLARHEATMLMKSPEGLDFSNFRGSPEEAADLIHKLYLCALADGAVDESEKQLFQHVASAVGISGNEVLGILASDQPADNLSFLNALAAMQFLGFDTEEVEGITAGGDEIAEEQTAEVEAGPPEAAPPGEESTSF